MDREQYVCLVYGFNMKDSEVTEKALTQRCNEGKTKGEGMKNCNEKHKDGWCRSAGEGGRNRKRHPG